MPVYGFWVSSAGTDVFVLLWYLLNKPYNMSKIKITEEQLKRLTERRHSYISKEEEVEESELTMDANIPDPEDDIEEDEIEKEVEETEEEKMVSESIMKIKSQFSRFL